MESTPQLPIVTTTKYQKHTNFQQTGGAGTGGAEPERVEPEGTASGGAEPTRAESGGALGVPLRREPLSPQQLREWYSRRCRGSAGAGAVGATRGAAGAARGASGAGAARGAAGAGAAVAAQGAAGARAAGAAGGAAGTGDPGAEGTGSVSAVSAGAARPRPYYVPLLQQVLGFPPPPGPPPPFLSPPPVQSQSQLPPATPLPGPSPYSGPTRGLTERREPESRHVSPESRSASPVRTVSAGRVSRPRPLSCYCFATADTKALAHVKFKVQKRHTCTDLGPSALRLHVLLAIVHSSAYRSLALSSTFGRVLAPDRHRKVHWDATKRVLRYLFSTSGMELVLGGRARVVLTGHADASWVDDLATQRSSQGYTFSIGSDSASWRSTHSSSVLNSSCEAEIYAGAMAAQELRWLTYLLTDLGEAPRSPPVLYVDNKAMLALCQEHRLEHRTKHIALRYFLARELQQRGQLRLAYVASQAKTADVFTKALQPCDHQPCFVFLDWSCDLLFSPILPMGVCQNYML
ncbi:unnamed protein product [Closterium sp. NIES-53]